MSKIIKILNLYTGEVILDREIDGDFQLQFTQNTDSGQIHRIGMIDNGRFGDKHWIKNYYFRPIAQKLVDKFDEIKHIHPQRILFLENTAWSPGKGSTKKTWIARICKANQWLMETWGYHYIMELKSFFMEKMSKEQVIATVYHELRHIDTDGDIKPHDVEDWDNMVATLGKNWAETKSSIINLLDDEFPGWNELRKAGQQINIFEAAENVISINRASKVVNGEVR